MTGNIHIILYRKINQKFDVIISNPPYIKNNSTTYYHQDETNGEIIELAKPTIKRVIKYTLQP